MKKHLNIAQPDRLAVFKVLLLNRRAINESAVRRTEVLDRNNAVPDKDLAVGTRHRGVGDLEVIGVATTKLIRAIFELNFPRGRTARINHQSVHS